MAAADPGRGGDEQPSDEELYEVLCRTRRRHVLDHLRQEGGSVSLSSLVESVAAREYEKGPEELTQSERRRIYVSLFQTHLPKLDRQGLIEWNRETNRVRLGSDVCLDEYLPQEWTVDGWYRYYLLIAGVGSALTVLAYADLWLFDSVDPTVTGAAVVGSSFFLAMAHGAAGRRRGD